MIVSVIVVDLLNIITYLSKKKNIIIYDYS